MILPRSSVKKTLKILQAFFHGRAELGGIQISEFVKFHKRSARQIFTALLVEGFVEENPRHAADEQGKNKRAQRPGS